MPEFTCPLPAVQEALAPYIHNRAETLQIRREIDQYFFARLENEDENATHLTRAFLSDVANPSQFPAPIDGVRRSYVKALQAHVTARTKFEGLRSELEELKQRTAKANDKQTDLQKTRGMDEYVALLALRQRQRRLEVIRTYLGAFTSDVNGLNMGLRDAVKRAIGDHPEAPPPLSGNGNDRKRSDELILKLKKAVLVAKYDMDRATEINDTQRDGMKSDLSGEVHALRHARDELVSWIEEQLAKVPEEPSIHENDDAAPEANKSASQTTTFSDIEDQYKSYIASRESLIHLVNSIDNPSALPAPTSPTKRTLFSRHAPKSSAHSPTHATRPNVSAPQEPSQIITLLPHIPALKDSSRTSQALLSQNAFLRRQLAGAEDDRKTTLERLAQESHLLPGGAQASISAWSQAAAGGRKEMRKFVEEKTSVGEKALAQGVSALTGVETDSRTVESLRGNVQLS